MDNREEIRDFLATRRAKITPAQAGLPVYGTHRRVLGLRREEVAMLAGVSVDYYTRLERGNLNGVSESVLDALATALQLDEAERIHLYDLARAARATPATRARRRAPQSRIRPSVQAMLDAMTGAPALVRNDRLDILATNPLGRALYSELYRDPVRPANHARYAFLDPGAHDFWIDWERAADDTVGVLRAQAGRNPYDRSLSDLVGELSTRSEEFRTRWAAHNVRLHRTGNKLINHPVVGRLELMYDTLPMPADPGLTMLVYTAAPGTTAADALQLLASWAATTIQGEGVPAPDRT
ncbi:helix-turn-helix transcriptional regulator [Pengzhenrongella frigida]|uniref:XRE family transcriptional regulator n=1 Tax=Pengzhenrongella frigida TaxID=1259133 RepID=A0A4Q5MVK7_9MICO|nr:helix-turn-helix transcriptional regulator [Cellulomonas sp. HLT2-17]RYV49636.1 XRE family transcriptional regulator [Cellulomonas sp. HLT2-17]